MTLRWIICLSFAYLVGSIPFGVIIGRLKGIDIRQHGSKNIGASNVGRTLGRRFGILCFFLDALKGALPVLLAAYLNDFFADPWSLSATQLALWFAVAVAAVVGHMFSIFLKLRGGKGVATGAGAMLAYWPLLTLPVLAALLVWFALVKLTRYISLASMSAACSVSLFYAIFFFIHASSSIDPRSLSTRALHASPPFLGTLAVALLIIYQHRSNISRLLHGSESRVGSKR